jgi:type II secretion system protein I
MKSGFTLLEVLVAVAVVAITGAVLLGTAREAVRAGQRARVLGLAVVETERILAESCLGHGPAAIQRRLGSNWIVNAAMVLTESAGQGRSWYRWSLAHTNQPTLRTVTYLSTVGR